MSRGIVLYTGFLALVFLSFFCIQIQAPAIERDLLSRSATALAAHHIPLAGVAFSGRDAVLSGARGSQEVSDRARQTVLNVEGVRAVELKITSEAPPLKVPETMPEFREVQGRLDAVLAGKTVDFSTVSADSTELTVSAKAVLNEIAVVLAQSPNVPVEIQGHTDSRVDPNQSETMSKRKADAVKAYLISKSISPDRLTTTGLGASKPIADNATWLGRRQNRRIEFEVKGGK